MKNRIIKIINILLIISFIFTPLISYAEPVETEETPEAEKGVLRCPISENGKSCIETKVNGVVVKTETTIQDENIKVTKVVETTDEIGKYKIYFKYSSKTIIQQKKPDVNIVLVLDASTSVTSWYNNNPRKGHKPFIPNAAKSFAKTFDGNSNAYLAVIKFNKTATILRGLENKNFDSVNFGSVVLNSRINLGMLKADELLENSNRINYVVILGDGEYTSSNLRTAIEIANKLRNNNTTIYTIAYGKGATNSKEKQNLINIAGSAGRYYPNTDLEKIEIEFKDVANVILGEISSVRTDANVNLLDKLGSSFTESDSLLDQKEINIKDISKIEKTTEPFYVKINPASETSWHSTNDGFFISYVDKDNISRKLNCSINPEVYWIQEKEDIDSCSGEIKSPKITKTITNSYYSIHCEEGYTENGKKYENFTTAMKVNSLDDGVEEFTLPSGAGFTAEVSLKTNIRCTYKFDASRYNSEYATLEREIAQLEKEIESLKTSSNNQVLESGDIAWCKYIDSSGDLLTPPITLGQVSDTSSIKPIELALYGKKVGDVFEVTMHDSLNDTDVIYTVTVVSIVKKVDILYKELIEKTLNFNSLTSIADDYLNTSSEMALDEYKDRFFNLSPGLGVSYKNKKGEVVVNLSSNIVDKEPKGDEKFNNKDEDPVCQGTEDTIKIGNKTVKVFNQTCTGNFWRIMNIEKICLNMKTGQTEKCSDTDTIKQLDGLNKHYTPLKLDEDTKKMMKLDGDIVITLEKAGYDESINVTLKNCTVKGQISDAYYREIDVTDPFLQKATHGQRAIGSNFKGEYDFVQIISPTIWNSNNPLYTFNLSKADVATIENDTTNLGKISYLGDDCYISNRKYVCTLPHQYKK